MGMLRVTRTKVKMKPGLNPRTRFPGICEFADALKISRGHAWQVLAGKRDSRKLADAWRKFQQSRAA
jgi:hypothetical protein